MGVRDGARSHSNWGGTGCRFWKSPTRAACANKGRYPKLGAIVFLVSGGLGDYSPGAVIRYSLIYICIYICAFNFGPTVQLVAKQ